MFGAQSFLRPRRGVLAVLFLLPVLKTAGSAGFLARFAIADVFLFLVLLGTIVSIARGRAGEWHSLRIPRQAFLALAAFLPLVLVSFFFSESVERSLIETVAYFVNVVFAALIIFHVRTRRDLMQAFLIWEKGIILTLVGGLAGLFLLFTGNFDTALTEGPKLASTFKKSGQLSAYLLPSIAVLWYNFAYLSPTKKSRILRGILFVILFVCLVGTGSRTGLALGAAAFLLLFGAKGARNFLRRPVLHLGMAAIAAVLFVGALRAVSSVLPFSFQRAFSIVSGESSLERLSPTRYYQFLGWEIAAAEYPIFGVGAGDFHSRTTSFVPAAWKSHEIHNTYLGIWAETGILGIFALILLYLGVMQAGWEGLGHSKDPELSALHFALLAALVVLVIYGMSNFGLRMRHLWAIFGLIIAAWNVTRCEMRGLSAGKAV